MITVLLWIWQLPQFSLGWLFYILLLFMGSVVRVEQKKINWVVYTKLPIGLSLGPLVFLYLFCRSEEPPLSLNHETGHSIQSQILGPFYLLVVGIPSITMNIISRFSPKFAENYYRRWPESWADKLGSVSR